MGRYSWIIKKERGCSKGLFFRMSIEREPCGSGSGQKPWSMRYEENSGKHKKMDIG